MKEILNVIHNTIYQFFDVCNDDEEVPMSDKDKLLLKVNKAICNNLKALEQEKWDATEIKKSAAYNNAIKRLEKSTTFTLDDGLDCVETLVALEAIMIAIASAQTRPTGHWIDDEFGSKCSCCGLYTHLDKFDRPMKFKYCSMCGAKMEEVQNADSN